MPKATFASTETKDARTIKTPVPSVVDRSQAPVDTSDLRVPTVKQLKDILRSVVLKLRKAHEEYRREFGDLVLHVTKRNQAESKDIPLKPNRSIGDVCPLPSVTPNSSYFINASSIEELTARQLRVTYEFVARQLSEIPPRILEEFAPECSYDSIVAIVNSHRLLRSSLDNAVKFMEECLVTFKGDHWFKGNYVYLAAWRAELFHCLTAITVRREVFQEEICPHFFDNNVDRDEFCIALELQKVSVDTLLPLLRRTSAICAHLTRLIRWIEFHQQAFLEDRQDADPEAVNLMTCYGMGIMSSYEEDSVPEYLEWWRKRYDQEYRSNKRFRRLTVERVEQIIIESVSPQSAEASNIEPGRPQFKSGGFGPRNPDSSSGQQQQQGPTPSSRHSAYRSPAITRPFDGAPFSLSREDGPHGSRSPSRRGGSSSRRGGSPSRRGGSPSRRGGSSSRRGRSSSRRGRSSSRRGGWKRRRVASGNRSSDVDRDRMKDYSSQGSSLSIASTTPQSHANAAGVSYLDIPPRGQRHSPHARRRSRSVDRRSSWRGERDRTRTPSRDRRDRR
uniref:Similar to n=1 Tax=Haemonchus contortus TaxID=6289 RepID=A0A7I4YIS2_HAECO